VRFSIQRQGDHTSLKTPVDLVCMRDAPCCSDLVSRVCCCAMSLQHMDLHVMPNVAGLKQSRSKMQVKTDVRDRVDARSNTIYKHLQLPGVDKSLWVWKVPDRPALPHR
jgi:hypothetical protein